MFIYNLNLLYSTLKQYQHYTEQNFICLLTSITEILNTNNLRVFEIKSKN